VNELKRLIKGKKVQAVEVDGDKFFIHFEDCVLECREAILCEVQQQVGKSRSFAPVTIKIKV